MAKFNDNATQLHVLALIARGDTYQKISEQTGIKIPTLQAIKNRNKPTLELMQSRLVEHNISASKQILDKAHKLIEKKLDRALTGVELLEATEQDYRDGKITREEYSDKVYGVLELSLTELNSVSREAFNQSQIEQGKPTSINNAGATAKDDLYRLVEAIKDGDEVALERIVFNQREYIEVDGDSTNETS